MSQRRPENGIPRPVLRHPETLAQSPIHTSALAIAEHQDFAHDTLYRALALFFEPSLKLCKGMGGLNRGSATAQAGWACTAAGAWVVLGRRSPGLLPMQAGPSPGRACGLTPGAQRGAMLTAVMRRRSNRVPEAQEAWGRSRRGGCGA